MCSATCEVHLSRGPSPTLWRRGGCSHGTRRATPRRMEANPRCHSDVGDRSGVWLVITVPTIPGSVCRWGWSCGLPCLWRSGMTHGWGILMACLLWEAATKHPNRCVLFRWTGPFVEMAVPGAKTGEGRGSSPSGVKNFGSALWRIAGRFRNLL